MVMVQRTQKARRPTVQIQRNIHTHGGSHPQPPPSPLSSRFAQCGVVRKAARIHTRQARQQIVTGLPQNVRAHSDSARRDVSRGGAVTRCWVTARRERGSTPRCPPLGSCRAPRCSPLETSARASSRTSGLWRARQPRRLWEARVACGRPHHRPHRRIGREKGRGVGLVRLLLPMVEVAYSSCAYRCGRGSTRSEYAHPHPQLQDEREKGLKARMRGRAAPVRRHPHRCTSQGDI